MLHVIAQYVLINSDNAKKNTDRDIRENISAEFRAHNIYTYKNRIEITIKKYLELQT